MLLLTAGWRSLSIVSSTNVSIPQLCWNNLVTPLCFDRSICTTISWMLCTAASCAICMELHVCNPRVAYVAGQTRAFSSAITFVCRINGYVNYILQANGKKRSTCTSCIFKKMLSLICSHTCTCTWAPAEWKGGGSNCKDCHKLLIFLCTEGTNVILFKIYIGIQCQQSKSKIF